ncbi:MAG: hypothetical protein FNCRV1_gp4 [Hangzhou nephotettix cincticeps rhabdovirus 1]|nr:MAG: hypothetical protein FNCRV1_gp4 [Hangzhou nephotettix cincticeps rhabdovirus 1]
MHLLSLKLMICLSSSTVLTDSSLENLKLSVFHHPISFSKLTLKAEPACRLSGASDSHATVPSYVHIYQQYHSDEANTGILFTLLDVRYEMTRDWFFSCNNKTISKAPYNIQKLSEDDERFWNQVTKSDTDWFKIRDSEVVSLDFGVQSCDWFSKKTVSGFQIKIQKVTVSWSVRGTLVDPIKDDKCEIGEPCLLGKNSLLLTRKTGFSSCSLIKIKTYPCIAFLTNYNQDLRILVNPSMYDITIENKEITKPRCLLGESQVFLTSDSLFVSLDRTDRIPIWCYLKYGSISNKYPKACELTDPSNFKDIPKFSKKRDVSGDLSIVPLNQKLDWVFAHYQLSQAHSVAVRNSLINATLMDLKALDYQVCVSRRMARILAQAMVNINPNPLLEDISGGKGYLFKQHKDQLLVSFGRTYLFALSSFKGLDTIKINGEDCKIYGHLGTTLCGFPDTVNIPLLPMTLIPLSDGGSYDTSTKKIRCFQKSLSFQVEHLLNNSHPSFDLYVHYSDYELRSLENSGLLSSEIPVNSDNGHSIWRLIEDFVFQDRMTIRLVCGVIIFLSLKFMIDLYQFLIPSGPSSRRGRIF